MRFYTGVLLAVSISGVAFAQGKKQIALEDIFKKPVFSVKGVPGFNAMKDGKHYTQLDIDSSQGSAHKKQLINVYDLETGKKERTLFTLDLPESNGGDKPSDRLSNFDEYQFSADEQKILLLSETQGIYRHSALHKVFIYDVRSGALTNLDKEKVLHATFSPDGKKVAFVKSNNLFYKTIEDGIVTQVSTDGDKNRIINGNCDWVYEEEFSFTRAYDWSSNSQYLAYYRFDETLVPEYTLAKYKGLYPEQYKYKYPKAGERNSTIEIKCYNLDKKQTVNVDLGTNSDIYIPRIKWMEDRQRLCVYRMNRLQNELELMLANPSTGKHETIYKEHNKYYIEINDEITFLPDGHSMIIRSDRSGYNHLYRYNWTTKNLTDLTSGAYDVDALVGVDKPRKLVYYTAAETSPLHRNLYVIGWDGYGRKCLTPETGMHSITRCEGFNYFLDKYSRLEKVPVYYLRNASGKIIRTLEDNSKLKSKMSEYDLGKISFMKIPGEHATLNAWMITPPNFDPNKKYPVLMYQYSGPGSQQVVDRFPAGNFWWHQMLAEKGYIVVCADGTGTGFRGEEFCKKTYLQLGKYESDDQIAVGKYLGKLPYVDKDRIGIWGWSYGGFMSSTCIMKGNDVFKAAIAVAPVTNWRFYDNIYTERYMRTPQENPKGYDDNSPEKMVDKLKGKFLYIHGTADDNVHFQNSAMMTTALINANKDYDSEYYPDKAHGISGGNTSLHLYRRMTNFILENL